MIVVPDSDIILIKSPLKLDNYNQITFSNASAQESYFLSLPHLEYDGCTYVRKDGVIRYNTDKEENPNAPRFEDLLGYNYCMYKNDSYSDKWFYAFVTDVKYINDGMSEVTIETDVFGTWQFNLNYMNSFIEREHVSDDIIGVHTIPENLETGEFTNHDDKTKFGIGSCHAVVCTSIDPFRQNTNYPYNVVNSIPSGLHYFVVGDFTSVNFIGWLTSWAAEKSDLSLIQSIFMVPDSMTGYGQGDNYWSYAINSGGLSYAPYHKLSTVITGSFNLGDTTITKPYHNIDGYFPRNNKLFVYPYNFMMIDNHGGVSEVFRYEDFTSQNCVFTTKGDITPGCSIRTIPRNYKHIDYNYSEGINALKLPIGSWEGDVYTNWLTQNSVNIGVNVATSTAGIISSVATGNVATGVSGVLGIASTLGSIYEHSRIPNQVYGNQNSGDVTYSDGESTFTLYRRTIKYEYAKIIDDFFTMYGYKVNRLATPNIHKRANWDYMKCIDVNIEGDVPEADLDKIRSLFNNGCTFWHNTSTFLNYSVSNGII